MSGAALSRRRLAWCGRGALAAVLVVALSGCGDDATAPAPETFPPLDYSYLPKLRLNVASISVQDGRPVEVDDPDNADALSPIPPYEALRGLANQRLVAAGNSGQAQFIIQDASIRQGAGRLDGALAVRLQVETSGGQQSGFAEAKVVRSQSGGPGDPDGGRGAAYRLVKGMLDDMNVELEFQIKHNLRDYLEETDSTVPAAGPVEAQPLPPPPGVSVAPAPPTSPPPPPPPSPVAPLPPLSES
jgi:hypothetical protein